MCVTVKAFRVKGEKDIWLSSFGYAELKDSIVPGIQALMIRSKK